MAFIINTLYIVFNMVILYLKSAHLHEKGVHNCEPLSRGDKSNPLRHYVTPPLWGEARLISPICYATATRRGRLMTAWFTGSRQTSRSRPCRICICKYTASAGRLMTPFLYLDKF